MCPAGDDPVVVLAGGTGGAKLARGMLDVVGEQLVVIANTGDDVEIYGGYVSPDPDLATFWLADAIDERGWGLAGDTFAVMEALRGLGEDVWFNLGDRDLAIALQRAQALTRGLRLTEAHAAVTAALNLPARVLPMCDEPVRTRVLAAGRWHPLQEFLIRHGGRGPIEEVEFRHAAAATPSPEVLAALRHARAIVIGPSNPIISIGPILAVPGMAQAIADSPAAVVAVSPLVAGRVLKGPTAECLRWAGRTLDSEGIASQYDGLLDGLIADERSSRLPTLERDVRLGSPAQRHEVAAATLDFALGLSAARRAA